MADIQHPTVPIECAGKWIAWDHDMTRIVASGVAPMEVLKAAKNAGENEPILGKVPRGILGPWRGRTRRVRPKS